MLTCNSLTAEIHHNCHYHHVQNTSGDDDRKYICNSRRLLSIPPPGPIRIGSKLAASSSVGLSDNRSFRVPERIAQPTRFCLVWFITVLPVYYCKLNDLEDGTDDHNDVLFLSFFRFHLSRDEMFRFGNGFAFLIALVWLVRAISGFK